MELAKSSPEFVQLEYRLKTLLRSTTLRLRRCHTLADPARALNYERVFKGTRCVESWLEARSLFGTTQADEIQRSLPLANLGAVLYPTGRPALPGSAGPEFVFVVFRVAVGRTVFSERHVDEVPEGFHTVSLEVKDADGQTDHRYLVADASSQVVPLYLAAFSYDAKLEERTRKRPMCEECRKTIAVFYSSLFQANMCEPCGRKGHAASELARKHALVPISKGPATFGPCPHHPARVVEYFCSTCCSPVCVDCKMVGNHAVGEQGNHRLVPAKEALDSCLENISQRDAIMQAQKAAIEHQLGRLATRGESISQNAENVKRAIQERCARALQEVEQLGMEKLTGLLGDDIELRRQLSEIDALQEFLEYQRTSFDGIQHLLVNWKTHSQLVGETRTFEPLQEDVDVRPDIRCKVQIEVFIDEEFEGSSGGGGGGREAMRTPAGKENGGEATPRKQVNFKPVATNAAPSQKSAGGAFASGSAAPKTPVKATPKKQ